MSNKMIVSVSLLTALSTGCAEHYLSDEISFSKEITRVDVSLDSSEIRVSTAEDETASVDYDVRYRGDTSPDVTTDVENGVLKVRLKCKWSCDGDFIVHVPASAGANISVDSGNVEVDGLEGDAHISADSGNIRLRNMSGDLNLTVDSGNISGDASSLVCEAQADSGNIDLRFTDTPDALQFQVDSGNIDIEVPEGAYDIRTSVDFGTERIRSLTIDQEAPSRIIAAADAGNITIQGY